MGRHSRGSGAAPAPPPDPSDPPARHPYAPRPVEDTGVRDHGPYRVVDVGLPPDAPGSSPLRPVSEAGGRSRFGAREGARPVGAGEGARPVGPEPTRFGAEVSRPVGPEPTRFGAEVSRPVGPEPTRYGATRADLAEPRYGTAPAEPRFGGLRHGAGPEPPRRGATRADLDVSPVPPAPEPSRYGATRADLAEPRYGATRADLAEPRRGGPSAESGRSGPSAESRRGGPSAESRRSAPSAESRRGGPGAELRYGGPGAESRYGATRVDLAESVGSTALAPLPAPVPDEVTDTGARRARSAFRLASDVTIDTEATHASEADEADEAQETDHDTDYEHEPALLLQWGIFVAQTLTGAVAGLGVWLGFYRLWSTWPFYAVPAVGVAAIGMLVLARTLRRRHGHDIDLLTAVVTVGISTVLTVLPAAFTLQGLSS